MEGCITAPSSFPLLLFTGVYTPSCSMWFQLRPPWGFKPTCNDWAIGGIQGGQIQNIQWESILTQPQRIGSLTGWELFSHCYSQYQLSVSILNSPSESTAMSSSWSRYSKPEG